MSAFSPKYFYIYPRPSLPSSYIPFTWLFPPLYHTSSFLFHSFPEYIVYILLQPCHLFDQFNIYMYCMHANYYCCCIDWAYIYVLDLSRVSIKMIINDLVWVLKIKELFFSPVRGRLRADTQLLTRWFKNSSTKLHRSVSWCEKWCVSDPTKQEPRGWPLLSRLGLKGAP